METVSVPQHGRPTIDSVSATVRLATMTLVVDLDGGRLTVFKPTGGMLSLEERAAIRTAFHQLADDIHKSL